MSKKPPIDPQYSMMHDNGLTPLDDPEVGMRRDIGMPATQAQMRAYAEYKKAFKSDSLTTEVAKSIGRHKGFTNIPHDAIVGLKKGLKKNYSLSAIADSALQNDPTARSVARRIFGKGTSAADIDGTPTSERYTGNKIQQLSAVLSHQQHEQTAVLLSIDHTLKELRRNDQKATMVADTTESEGTIKRLRAPDAFPTFRSSGKALSETGSELGKGVGKFAKDNFTIGNFLKYGAAIGSIGYDAYQGANKSAEWGTHPAMGAAAGMIGGAGKGGFTLALKKAFELGTIGSMLAGPVGALVGAIIGAISGWIGGESMAKLMDTSLEKAKTSFVDAFAFIATSIEHGINGIGDIWKDRFDWIGDKFKGIIQSIRSGMLLVLANIQDQWAAGFDMMSKVPGMGGAKAIGDQLHGYAAANRDESDKLRKEEDDRVLNRDRQKYKERDVRDAQVDLKGGDLPADFSPPKSVLADAKPASPTAALTITKPGKKTNSFTSGFMPVVSPTSPERITSAPDNGVKVSGDLTVGDVPGDDIKAAVKAANALMGINGRITDQLAPHILAANIAAESGGKLDVSSGDGGDSVGIGQMKQIAIDDINQAFGTRITHDAVKKDYRVALLASALYLRLLQSRSPTHSTIDALAAYKGGGDAGMANAMNVIDKAGAIDYSSSVTPVAPEPSEKGMKLVRASTENSDLTRENSNRGVGSIVPINAPTINNVDQSSTINTPIPPMRNSEQTFVDTTYR